MFVELTKNEFIEKIQNDSYKSLGEFLNKKKPMFLCVSGSHGYGIANENSDIDLRGCCHNSKEELLLRQDFEQFTSTMSDSTVYSFNKLMFLLTACNPNVIELLGLRDKHYLFTTKEFNELRKNSHMFLSKKAVNTFGGYATMQLRRLDNKSCRTLTQPEREKHILNTLKNVQNSFEVRYADLKDKTFNLYLKDLQGSEEKEIYMDVNFKNCSLREFNAMYSELNNAVKEYDKLGSRNSKAIEHGKLGKHMAHLFRLYYTCFDILEKEQIITYRETEREFLKEVREEKFIKDNKPTREFFEILDELEKRLHYASENTSLPECPDIKKISEFKMDVNEKIIKDLI